MTKNMAVVDENNKVLNIMICDDSEIETSNFICFTDDNPAYIGGDYIDGFFYAPQPFPSWVRHNGNWEAPVPKPDSGMWLWNEELLSWEEVEEVWKKS